MAHLDMTFYSPSLQGNTRLIVFLPDQAGPRQVPTLYLLHGSFGGCMDWCLNSGIERYAAEKGIAVVMPAGENSWYVNTSKRGQFLTYIGHELPLLLPKLLPLSQRREDTYIAGLSMGGYGAMRVALGYPETFSHAASLSGALDLPAALARRTDVMVPNAYQWSIFPKDADTAGTRNDLFALLPMVGAEAAPKLYLTCGTEDFHLAENEAFHALACRLGVNSTLAPFPGNHNWDFWDAHIRDVLDWLPSGNL